MRVSHDMTTTIDAEKLHRQRVDEAIKEARTRAAILENMALDYNNDAFIRDSCQRKAETLRTLYREIERLRGVIGGGRNV